MTIMASRDGDNGRVAESDGRISEMQRIEEQQPGQQVGLL